MRIDDLKQQGKRRMLLASLVIAIGIIGGAIVQMQGEEKVGVVWLTTAVYMVSLFTAAGLMMPLVEEKGWLFGTATLLAVTIVVPGAFLHPEQWAMTQLQPLGSAANTLFLALGLSLVEWPDRYRGKRWIITGFYTLIMLVLTFLL